MPPTPPPTSWYILGAGAIGSLWAFYWRHSGFPVVLITQTAVKRSQIHLRREKSITSVDVTSISIEELQASNTVISQLLISTKAQQTLNAVTAIQSSIAADATVLVLQNGMAGQQLPKLLPTQTLITGITSDGAFLENKDTVVHAGKGITYIGADASMLHSLPIPSLNIRTCEDIVAKQWRKLAVNCAINGLTAIYRCRNGALLTNPAAMVRIEKLCHEVMTVAKAEGLGEALANIEDDVVKTLTDTAENYSSMYQDIIHNRKTEINFINGYIIELGEYHGIACDENQAIVTAIKAMEPH